MGVRDLAASTALFRGERNWTSRHMRRAQCGQTPVEVASNDLRPGHASQDYTMKCVAMCAFAGACVPAGGSSAVHQVQVRSGVASHHRPSTRFEASNSKTSGQIHTHTHTHLVIVKGTRTNR